MSGAPAAPASAHTLGRAVPRMLSASTFSARVGTVAFVARAFPARPRRAPARGGRHAIRASSDDLDGADAGPADDGLTGNPLFTPDFKKAFMEAQERIEAREAPDRARIDAEVAEIMARVETERDLESQLPEDDEPPEPEPSSPSVARERVEEEYGGALNNPLFTPEFKEAFIQAQERIAEREAPMRAKIKAEVDEIMAQVNAERAAAARGEPHRPRRSNPGTPTSLGSAPTPTPPPPPTPTPAPSSADVDVLRRDAPNGVEQIDRLRAAMSGLEAAALAEQMQLQRIEFALEKAARDARYAEADRVARERRDQMERGSDASR